MVFSADSLERPCKNPINGLDTSPRLGEGQKTTASQADDEPSVDPTTSTSTPPPVVGSRLMDPGSGDAAPILMRVDKIGFRYATRTWVLAISILVAVVSVVWKMLFVSTPLVGVQVLELERSVTAVFKRKKTESALSPAPVLLGSDKPTGVPVYVVPSRVVATMKHDLVTAKNLPSYKTEDEDRSKFIAFSQAFVRRKLLEGGQDQLLDALSRLDSPLSPSAILVRLGYLLDPHVGLTPTDGTRTIDKPTEFAEIFSAGLAGIAKGHLVSYDTEKEYSNRDFHVGFPLEGGDGSAINSIGTLPWHCDMSYCNVNEMPDYLVLACVREGNDKDVLTPLINNKILLGLIPKEIQEVLRQPRYILKQPSWVTGWIVTPKPLLSGSNEDPVFFPPAAGKSTVHLQDPDDTEAQEALDALYDAIHEMETQDLISKTHLETGDFFIFHNKRNLHSKYSYVAPLFDGNDRILIRSYYITNVGDVELSNGYVVLKQGSKVQG